MGKLYLTQKNRISIIAIALFMAVFSTLGLHLLLASRASPNALGDCNGDGSVTVTDLSLLLSHYGQAYSVCNFNNDGVVNIFDLSILLAHFGQTQSGPGIFTVSNNKIYDPNGNRFVVKGIQSVQEYFVGDNGNAQINYTNYQRDLDAEKALGANYVRIFVSPDVALNIANYDNQHLFGGSTATFFQRLDTVVNYATQTDKMVVELTAADTDSASEITTVLGDEAARYKDNPYVWLEPDNEPNCSYGDTTKCQDWAYWQTQENGYIQTIRSNGFTGPIVVNSIDWSNDMRQIGSYPLTDSGHKLIYGVHRYGDSATAVDTSYESMYWSSLAASYPMIVDEVGIWDTGVLYQPNWTQQFLDYAASQVNSGPLNGLNGFDWFAAGANVNGTYYSDAMEGDPSTHTSNNTLTTWGEMFRDHYLNKVTL